MENMAATIRENFRKLYTTNRVLNEVLHQITEHEGPLYIFGGAVRDLGFFNKQPRDLDIVVDTQNINLDKYFTNIPFSKNRFGGYKLDVNGLEVDIWAIPATFSFKMKLIEESVPNLLKTPVLSIDSILYDITNEKIFDAGCIDSLSKKEIDLIHVPEHESVLTLNFVRALVFADTNNFHFSKQLLQLFKTWYSTDPKTKTKALLDQYTSRYKAQTVNVSFIEYLVRKQMNSTRSY